MKLRIGLLAAVLVAALVPACSSTKRTGPAPGTSSTTGGCPSTPDAQAFASASDLRQMNEFVGGLGVRPTGSAAHGRYVDWIEQQARAIKGVQVSETPFTIDRWSDSHTSLHMNAASQSIDLPVASAVSYAPATPAGGVTAPFAYLPDDQPITAANAAGKLVVRPAPAGSVSQSVFSLPIVGWSVYDPKHTINPSGSLVGDFINYDARVTDLRNAQAAGAAGLVFVKDLPRSQILGHYEPYEGRSYGPPALWLGADEGKQITDAIAAGVNPVGTLTLDATTEPTQTKTITATIPGRSNQRLVIESHTDGTNAVEDNGPVAMLAIAKYFAALPVRCRARTLEFAFGTAHFYQRLVSPDVRNGGAEALAESLDREYDHGSVAGVVTLEHLGAIDYEAKPRADGGPGDQLVKTNQTALQEIAITPSDPLVAAVTQVVQRYGLDRTVLLKGADAPGPTVPQHCNFGGEGTPFDKHLLPTVGEISAPETLYDPAFGVEGIDFSVMHAETLAFTDLLMRMGTMSNGDIAGTVTGERALRAAGAPACPA